jgi:hypothetical protein
MSCASELSGSDRLMVARDAIRQCEGAMGIGDAAHLAANSLDQLGTALSYLRPDRSGYITAEEYERITGEELGEFSTKGAR